MQKILLSLKTVFYGFTYVSRNKWTWKYITGAIFVNFILFISLLAASSFLLNYIINAILSLFNIEVNSAIGQFITGISILFGIILALFLFVILGNIANAPIYGAMVEKYLQIEAKNSVFVQRSFLGEIGYSLQFELKKLIILILILILTLFINLIPLIGQVLYIILLVIQLILYAGFDFFDGYLSRLNLTLRQKVKYIISDPKYNFPCLGICGFLVTIPFLNIIVWPFFILSGLRLALEGKAVIREK